MKSSAAVKKLGLVLSGGGARSAYQAGALLGLGEITHKQLGRDLKFQVICGISGGAINGTYLAAKADRLPEALRELSETWQRIGIDDIFDPKAARIFGNATRLVLQLGGGGMFNSSPKTQLLDTTPLVHFLLRKIDFKQLHANIKSGLLHGVAVTATNYGTGTSVAFFDGSPELQPWMRSRRVGKRTPIRLKHVLASSAIPILFPPIKVHGSYYGDGGVRMTSPLSPAIHLGSEKVIAIGVRYHRTPTQTFELNESFRMKSIQLADISGLMLNALFMDAIDSDLERMMRINQTLNLMTEEARREHPEKLRRIPVLAIRPSRDLGQMAADELKHLSFVLRHFLRGLGASDHHGADLVSYLAFESSYTSRLLELGYNDVMANKVAILSWLQEESPDVG